MTVAIAIDVGSKKEVSGANGKGMAGMAASRISAEPRVGQTTVQAIIEKARNRLECMVRAVENVIEQSTGPSGHIVKKQLEEKVHSLGNEGLILASLIIEHDGKDRVGKKAIGLIMEHCTDDCSRLLAEKMLGKIALSEHIGRSSTESGGGW
jgi:hypothetical protein